ncbi:hypothetical protein CK223_33020 [Mesorhizobium loti]|nr:hypothetical protein CK223_33020 [Mesorhizobium loti]
MPESKAGMAFAACLIEIMSVYRTIFGLLTDGLYQRFRQAAEEKRASWAQSVFHSGHSGKLIART